MEGISAGGAFPLWSIAPFLGMLASLAFLPLIAARFWHDHFGKISLFWAVLAAVPLLVVHPAPALKGFAEIILSGYLPFILLITALYTISGGILLKGQFRSTPPINTAILAGGAILSSVIGTTGAAILLIRPFLRANAHRRERAFMAVFFIFLVANIGGSLTPLGDPPLFLGFLEGVPFFWTLHMLPSTAFLFFILLALYFVLDFYRYRKECDPSAVSEAGTNGTVKIVLEGKINLLFALLAVCAVSLSGLVHAGNLSFLGVQRSVEGLARDAVLVLLTALSMVFTPCGVRQENEFTWFPVLEVGIIFAALFVAMMPCLRILEAGQSGALSPLIRAARNPSHFFWATGLMSIFLDNAPAYLAFLHIAIGKFYPGVSGAAAHLAREKTAFVEGISAGAVFFGAMSYIGNAPNFMVRTIAEESGVRMPGFPGYMIKYSAPILLPLFLAITLIFF